MIKNKTNRQILAKAVKELSDIDLVFMRERLLTSCDEVLDNADQFRRDHQFGMINPDAIIRACQGIKDKIDFEN
jgi:hypothetical protein